MKIYHTETQEDYDALMAELEEQGCKWSTGDKTTELTKNWKRKSSETCVRVDKKVVTHDEKGYFTWKYPDVPITKYKAKADEKMRFTKENVEKVIDEYFWQAGLEPCGDLIAEIHNLDDTPEKVVVQKFVAEWIESYLSEGGTLKDMLYSLTHSHSYLVDDELLRWFKKNTELMLRALLEGYEVEKEPLYEVLLPYAMWSDERSELVTDYQKLLFDKTSEETTFVPRQYIPVNNDYTCKLTESDIKEIDERYIPFMVPVDGVNKD